LNAVHGGMALASAILDDPVSTESVGIGFRFVIWQ
jgi:hypothetical protein